MGGTGAEAATGCGPAGPAAAAAAATGAITRRVGVASAVEDALRCRADRAAGIGTTDPDATHLDRAGTAPAAAGRWCKPPALEQRERALAAPVALPDSWRSPECASGTIAARGGTRLAAAGLPTSQAFPSGLGERCALPGGLGERLWPSKGLTARREPTARMVQPVGQPL
mmetsp:Transcript_54069/g.170006  ORF Transcript_54069/g.170006 Transcript_54069/m.170006 type:complete len:170 (+) Transcript_54069:490-999(+)